jgi:hypothetical protein
MAAFENRLRFLADDVHADWRDPWLPASWGGRTALHDWACALGVDRPALAELADPMLRMALLPTEGAQRVMVMRALLRRRRQVRTCIDPQKLGTLCAAVGHVALQSLVTEGLEVLHQSPNQDFPDACALAWEGYQMFAADGDWHDDSGLARLLRLRFPRACSPLFAHENDPAASRWVLQRWPLLVKEQSWWSDSTGMVFMSTWN